MNNKKQIKPSKSQEKSIKTLLLALDYTYDNNGNVLTETTTPYDGGVPQTPEVATNVYDVWNQLIQTTTSDNVVVVNGYNGEGIRVSKSVDGTITHYLYNKENDKVVLELNNDGMFLV